MSEPQDPKSSRRSVGERLGGWARRFGDLVADATGRPAVIEPLREPLAETRVQRLGGEQEKALETLRRLANEYPKETFVNLAVGLTLVSDLVHGGRPLKALRDATEALGDQLGRGPAHVLQGAVQLFDGHPERAHDELRRGLVGMERLTADFEMEIRMWLHLLAGLAHLELGHEERALRELLKARARVPTVAGAIHRALLLERGVGLALAAGQLEDAELWVRDVLVTEPDHPRALELQCRVAAAKGDRIGAHALLEKLGDEPVLGSTWLWVGLTVGLPPESRTALRTWAWRELQATPDDPAARRRWALAELAEHRLEDADTPMDADLRTQVVAALVDFSRVVPPATRDRALQELAHVALRLDVLEGPATEMIAARLRQDEATAPEELRLLRARARLRFPDDSRREDDFLPGDPPQFRSDPDVGGPYGPDPLSPVRRVGLRVAFLEAQRALVAAEYAVEQAMPDSAADLLVEALTAWPGLCAAQAALGRLSIRVPRRRLEEVLDAATDVLAAVPNRILGVPLDQVALAMRQVVAARERLARPLSIAIMGEFSAGKSTFVNALLGETVAPMGVLPTTTTINVFRRGPGGGGRIHYRDGRVALVEPDQVHAFLQGLDDTEAQRIRHVEIERTGSRMGDSAVIDTPGLNALDEYHERVAREFIDEADAVVWVFSATRGGAASEASMLNELRESGRQVLGVLNKADTLDAQERDELSAYLRAQLGTVLVDVIALEGERALAWRTTSSGVGADPFADVEAALDRHFLQKARELKRALTVRRLGEALAHARSGIEAAAGMLESRAEAASAAVGDRSPSELVRSFSTRVMAGILEIDDVLIREGLSLGLLQTGQGLAKGPMDPLDADYLETCLRDAALKALQRALAEVGRVDPTAAQILNVHYVPWAKGYLDGLVIAHFLPSLFERQGQSIREGEQAARAAFRQGLESVARAWEGTARAMGPLLEQGGRRATRQRSHAPRAEALRLRTVVAANIASLQQACDGTHA